MAIGLNPTHRLCDVVQIIKSRSSNWLEHELGIPGFTWQVGYGAFTFGAPDLERVVGCIERQEKHHWKQTFQEEYVAMLKRGMVEYKEEYLW